MAGWKPVMTKWRIMTVAVGIGLAALAGQAIYAQAIARPVVSRTLDPFNPNLAEAPLTSSGLSDVGVSTTQPSLDVKLVSSPVIRRPPTRDPVRPPTRSPFLP